MFLRRDAVLGEAVEAAVSAAQCGTGGTSVSFHDTMAQHDKEAELTRSGHGRWTVGRWVLLLVGMNLLWRAVRYGIGFPIWGDEAFLAVNFQTRGFAGLIEPLDHYQIAPLLFLWIEEAVSRVLGFSEYALRLVPFAVGLASVLLFVKLSRQLLVRHAALLAIAVFAASYYPVRHAAEIKPYSMDLFVALLILLNAWWVHNKSNSIGRWLAFGVLSAIAVWLSYPSVFVSGGALAVLGLDALRRRSIGEIIDAIFAGAMLGGSFIGMYLVFGAGQAAAGAGLAESGHWSFTFPPIKEPWLLPWWFIRVHTGNMFAYPNGGNEGGSAATFILFVFGCIGMWRTNRKALFLLLSPLPLMFIAAVLEKYPYGGSARVAQHFAPAVCLLAGYGLLVVFRRFMTPRAALRAVSIACVVFIAFIVGGMVRDSLEPYKKFSDYENKRVMQELAEQTPEHCTWVIYGKMGGSEIVPDFRPWGGSAARFRFNVIRYAPVDIRWGPDRLTMRSIDTENVWLICYEDNKSDIDKEKLTAYLAKFSPQYAKTSGPQEYALHDEHDGDEAIIVYHFRRKSP